MKKVLKASIIVAAAFAFGCAAVACGDDDNNNKKPPQEPETVTVSFDLGYTGTGVTNPAAQTVDKGATISAPDDVADRTGWDLEGWYVGSLDGDKFNFDTTVSADMTLVANWTIADGYYSVKYSAAADVNGKVPETQAVAAGAAVTIPENPFTKTGWTFYRWKNVNAGSYLSSNEITVEANMEFRAVFKHEYTGNYSNIIVFDDGFFIEGDDEYGYSDPTPYSIGWFGYLQYDTYYEDIYYGTYSYRLNDDNTFDEADGMELVVFTTDDGETELTFDGFGKAFLGEHEGTYKDLDPSNSTITLVFGETTYSALPYEMDDETYALTALTAEITIDGTTYTFGAAPALWEGTIPAKYEGTYTGEDSSEVEYEVVIADNKITIAIGGGEAVEAEIYAYDVVEDTDGTLENFTLKVDGVDWMLIKTAEDGSEITEIMITSGSMMSGNMIRVTCTRVSAEDGGDGE